MAAAAPNDRQLPLSTINNRVGLELDYFHTTTIEFDVVHRCFYWRSATSFSKKASASDRRPSYNRQFAIPRTTTNRMDPPRAPPRVLLKVNSQSRRQSYPGACRQHLFEESAPKSETVNQSEKTRAAADNLARRSWPFSAGFGAMNSVRTRSRKH
jgi:hypothetical protein